MVSKITSDVRDLRKKESVTRSIFLCSHAEKKFQQLQWRLENKSVNTEMQNYFLVCELVSGIDR